MIQKNCSLKDFLCIPQIEIICFGAGNYCRAFFDECHSLNKIPNVVAIGDNNPDLHEMFLEGKHIPVIGIVEIVKRVGSNTVLLLTTAYYKEILEQLEAIDDLKGITCYIYPMMQIYAVRNSSKIYEIEKTPQIPKKIHYCWFGGEQIPSNSLNYIQGWQHLCPDYEVIKWNEDNYDINKNAYVREACESGNFAFASDFARIDILYRYGGFYFDTDVELLRDIEPLRYHKGFLGTEAAGGVASGLGCGFAKKHKFLHKLLNEYEKSVYVNEAGNFIQKVNANYETELLRSMGYVKSSMIQVIQDVTVYPFWYFSPLIVGTDICQKTSDTYSIHHYHYSWRK